MGNIIDSIHWLHHASFRLEVSGKIIYLDPWKIRDKIKADYIFVTHEHYDHLSVPDILELSRNSTVIICPVNRMDDITGGKITRLKPGEKHSDGFVKAEAMPAYNTGKSFHEKSSQKNGYVFEIGGSVFYQAGDTDFIPEMKNLKKIDVAFLPVGGTYTMDPGEAAAAAEAIKPGIAVPMHWGSIVGTRKDAEEFKKLAKCRVEILKEEEPI